MNPRFRAALPLLLDLVLPVVGYAVLLACGVREVWALLISGGVTAVFATVNTVRHRRFDGFGALVLAEIALAALLLLLTRDPRIVLLKPSFATALTGVFLLVTCCASRPFVLDLVKPLATRGDPRRARAYEEAWRQEPGFRREFRLLTAVWGVLWLAESVVRALVVLHGSISQGAFLGQLPAIVALLVGGAYTRTRVRGRLRPCVNAYLAAGQPDERANSTDAAAGSVVSAGPAERPGERLR